MSPAGTQGYYGEETYKPYEAMNMMEGWRKYTKKEIDEMNLDPQAKKRLLSTVTTKVCLFILNVLIHSV